MLQYIKKMITEKEDLEGRIKKAKAALNNADIKLNEKQKELLSNQIDAMKNYLHFLNVRIEYETKGNK